MIDSWEWVAIGQVHVQRLPPPIVAVQTLALNKQDGSILIWNMSA